jgi:uncharacterized membrane protein YgdD (TMEM256/DUF423 family)
MNKTFIRIGIFLGAMAVILGAMGAHALEKILTGDALESYLTAVRYQMYHAFALIILGIYGEVFGRNVRPAGILFLLGIVFFSGSIYGLLALKQMKISYAWLGPVTPIGGSLLIAGWITWLWKTFEKLKS